MQENLLSAPPPLSQIVASLAILGVSVILFLYFRRHYRSYQERRARRVSRQAPRPRRIERMTGVHPSPCI